MGESADAELLSRAIENPGRLILGPTSTSSGPTYGGQSLGFHLDGEITWNTNYQLIQEPSSGLPREVSRRSVEYPIFYCLIDGPHWDEDLLTGAFSSTTAASSLPVQSPAETRINGTTVPFGVSAWPPILFAPLDPSQKGIYIRRPFPLLSLAAAVALSKDMGAGLPMRFFPSPDSMYLTIPFYQCCRVENMIL